MEYDLYTSLLISGELTPDLKQKRKNIQARVSRLLKKLENVVFGAAIDTESLKKTPPSTKKIETPPSTKKVEDDDQFYKLEIDYDARILIVGNKEQYDDFVSNGFTNVLFRSSINIEEDVDFIVMNKE